MLDGHRFAIRHGMLLLLLGYGRRDATNDGAGDTPRDWVDYVYLSDDAAVGNDVFLGQFPSPTDHGWYRI